MKELMKKVEAQKAMVGEQTGSLCVFVENHPLPKKVHDLCNLWINNLNDQYEILKKISLFEKNNRNEYECIKTEADDLKIRFDKFSRFTDKSEKFMKLPLEEQVLMIRQKHAMGDYLITLNNRLALAEQDGFRTPSTAFIHTPEKPEIPDQS